MAFYKCQNEEPIVLVPWSTGTDKQIKRMIDAYYAGEITAEDIQSVWHIGDTRSVRLSAMDAVNVSETHAAQNVEFRILDFASVPTVVINGNAVVGIMSVGQADCLKEPGQWAKKNNYNFLYRKAWLDNEYQNSLPSATLEFFKPYNLDGNIFFLPTEKQVSGRTDKSGRSDSRSQISYYSQGTAYRKKKVNGTYSAWWTQNEASSTNYGVIVTADGSMSYLYKITNQGLAPMGNI